HLTDDAALGGRTLTVTTGAEVVSLANAFTVSSGAPMLLTVSPNTGQQGQQNLNVQVTGQFTNFVQGTTLASFGAGVSVNSVTVANATSLTANISITANAALGGRTLTVTTGAEVVSLANAFTVTAGTPVLLTVSPNTGQQGQQNLNVQVTGQFTKSEERPGRTGFSTGVEAHDVPAARSTSRP